MAADADKARKDRHKAYMEQDFQLNPTGSSLNADMRIANALEYIAFQLGQINRKMDALTPIASKADK